MSNLLKSDNGLKRAAMILILLIAAFVFWRMSGAASENGLRLYGGLTQVRMGGQGLTVSAADGLLESRDAENDDMKFTAWTERNGVRAENYALGLAAVFDKSLCYYGDNQGFFSLISDDGCSLSEAAAYELFGAAGGILGETVMIDGERYIVEKLHYDSKAPLIYKVKGGNLNFSFDVLDVTAGESQPDVISDIRMRFGIRGDIAISYESVIKFFSLSFYIPDSFIPTRWSEFEFWSGVFSHYSGAVKYYMSMKTYSPDDKFRSLIITVISFTLLSAAFLIAAAALAIKTIRKRGVKIGVNIIKGHLEKVRKFGNAGGKRFFPRNRGR